MTLRLCKYRRCGDILYRQDMCDWHYYEQAARGCIIRAQEFDLPYEGLKELTKHLVRLSEASEGTCKFCDHQFLGKETSAKPTVDKIIPQYGYVKKNLQIICLACNAKKSGFSILDPFYIRMIEDQLAVQENMKQARSIKTFETV